jgi:hypothetical protein
MYGEAVSMATDAHEPRRSKVGAWIVFLFVLLLLSSAALPGHEAFSAAIDRTLVAIRLTLVLILSVLIIQERFVNKSKPVGNLLQRCRRWFYDE